MFDSFVKRFIAATSYSAFSLILAKSPPHMMQGLTPVYIAGVVLCYKLRGVQNVFAMLAAQGITDILPVPSEPVGYLILPASMFYFSVIATISWGIHCALSSSSLRPGLGEKHQNEDKDNNNNDTAASAILDEYVGLFCTSKIVSSFLAAKQEHVLGIISFSYLVLPSSSMLFSENSSCCTGRNSSLRTLESQFEKEYQKQEIDNDEQDEDERDDSNQSMCLSSSSSWSTQFFGMVDGLVIIFVCVCYYYMMYM